MYNFEYFPEEEAVNTTESQIEPRACSTIASIAAESCSNLISQGGGVCVSFTKSCTTIANQSGTPVVCPVGSTSNGKDYDCVFDRNSYPCSGLGSQTLACAGNKQIKNDPELRQAIKLYAIRSAHNGVTWVRSEFAPLASCAGGERNCTTCLGNTTQTGCTNCSNNAADGGGSDWCPNTNVRFQPGGGGGTTS